MRILMVNKFLYPNGGSETYMFKLGKQLEDLGHFVQYFGMKDEKNIVGNDYDVYVENVDYRGRIGGILKNIKAGVETIYSWNARKQIKVLLEKFQPDIVHLNNINFQITPAIIYEIQKYHIPIVQTVHDVQISCPCHRFYIEHQNKICEACGTGKFYKCAINRCLHHSFGKSVIAMLESYYYHKRDIYNLVDMYICPSRFIGSRITKAGVREEKIRVIYNFADGPAYECLESGQRSKYVLYFGRFSKEKGILTLLDVCKELCDIKFVVAGKGPLEKQVEQNCETLENVEYVGFKTGKELQQLIANAAFSVYPSEWYENCPLSVIESQALGTPVIGSDLGGTKELIKDGETGFVFEGCSREALRKAIRELWDDDMLMEKMSIRCRCIEVMNLEEYTNQIVKWYGTIVGGGIA